jgi:hypothetical protein
VLEPVLVAVPLKFMPKKPPMRPKTILTKFIEIIENTSTSMLPSFLCAALLYSSHDPTMVAMPARLPTIKTMLVGKTEIVMEPRIEVRNVASNIQRPETIDSAKAAVGFGSTFTDICGSS